MITRTNVMSMRVIFTTRTGLFLIGLAIVFNMVAVGVSMGQKPGSYGPPDRNAKAEAGEHFDMGVTHQNTVGEEARAVPEFLRAIELRQGHYPEAWNELARSYRFALRFEDDIVDAHEFGHAFDALGKGNPATALGNEAAVDSENYVRERRIMNQRRVRD